MLPRDILQQVRRIHLRTSRLVDDVLAGAYHSTFKGRGMEFDEVREYMPGDEVRTIDWNVTARRGQPYVKRYVEERELTVMLLVDLSASGQFGSVLRLKTEIATELCAVLAWSAIRNHDKVGLILFTDHIEKFLPPQKGRTLLCLLSPPSVLELDETGKEVWRRTALDPCMGSAALPDGSRWSGCTSKTTTCLFLATGKRW